MAEIEIGNAKYVTLDDKTASARSIYCREATFQKTVKIEGKEYTVTRLDGWVYRVKNIPDSVTSIDGLCDCSNITIPDSTTMLNRICNSTLTIPASVTTITEICGEGGTLCLRMESATPPVLAKATNLAKDDVLIVPEGAAEAYKKHPAWGKFKNISEDPSLNKDSVPSSSNKVSSNSKEMSELKKELNELRKDIANLMKLHKELREDFEELKKKD